MNKSISRLYTCIHTCIKSHDQELNLLLEQLQKYNLSINKEKSIFFQTSITYLGENLSHDGVSIDFNQVDYD